MAKEKNGGGTAKGKGRADVAEPARKQSDKAEKPAAGTLVYVGPTIRGTMLRTFTIFSDGVPREYAGNTAARSLFIEPGKLDEARREVGTKGSRLHYFYQEMKAQADMKGGKR